MRRPVGWKHRSLVIFFTTKRRHANRPNITWFTSPSRGKKKKRKIIMKFLQNDSCLRVMATYFTSFRNRRPVQHKNPDFSVDDHLRRRGTKTKRKTERRRFLSSRSYWSLARSNKRRPPRHSAGRHVQLNVQLFIVIIIDIIWIVIMIIHGSIGWRRGSYVRMRARKAEKKRKR